MTTSQYPTEAQQQVVTTHPRLSMPPSRQFSVLLSRLTLLVVCLLGIAAFLYPFALPPVEETTGPTLAHAQDAPVIFLLLIGLGLILLFADLETRHYSARVIAVLGVLTAINASLRLVPGAGGASLMFLLPILCGYVFGSEFGFLLGALSLFVSALLTGGVGPWLPFQMFTIGWIGLTAGWLPRLESHPRAERALLALFAAGWGFLFGAIMNLWFWPFLAGAREPGLSSTDLVSRYLSFYVATSLLWDLSRAVGNVVLILALAGPLLKLLRRFYRRFDFHWTMSPGKRCGGTPPRPTCCPPVNSV